MDENAWEQQVQLLADEVEHSSLEEHEHEETDRDDLASGSESRMETKSTMWVDGDEAEVESGDISEKCKRLEDFLPFVIACHLNA